MKKILKPATAPSTVSIRVPFELSQRLSAARAAAAQQGLTLDIDQTLAKALGRLIKQAEAELSDAMHADEPAAVALENEGVPHVSA